MKNISWFLLAIFGVVVSMNATTSSVIAVQISTTGKCADADLSQEFSQVEVELLQSLELSEAHIIVLLCNIDQNELRELKKALSDFKNDMEDQQSGTWFQQRRQLNNLPGQIMRDIDSQNRLHLR